MSAWRMGILSYTGSSVHSHGEWEKRENTRPSVATRWMLARPPSSSYRQVGAYLMRHHRYVNYLLCRVLYIERSSLSVRQKPLFSKALPDNSVLLVGDFYEKGSVRTRGSLDSRARRLRSLWGMRYIRRKGFSDSRRRTSDEGEVHYGAVEAGRKVKDPKPPKWRRLIQLSGKPKSYLERETGIEPATLCLEGRGPCVTHKGPSACRAGFLPRPLPLSQPVAQAELLVTGERTLRPRRGRVPLQHVPALPAEQPH
jgi:hypothetical protein